MRSTMLWLVMLLAVGTSGAVAQAKLEIEGGETYNWGAVKPPADGNLDAVIKLKNVGDKPLKLTEIKPGCGCTKTDPDKMELLPGEVSTMPVKLNISPAQSGPVTKSITVRWGDADGIKARDEFRKRGGDVAANLDTNEKVAFIFLKADIQRAIVMTPSIYLSFQDLEVGKQAETKIQIKNNSDQEIVFSNWAADNDLAINVSGTKKLAPKESMELVATLSPGLKGQYSALVSAKTNHPDYPTLEVRAYGFVKESSSPVFQKSAK